MRDLFQVVFDLKKKEIEQAKSQVIKDNKQQVSTCHVDPRGRLQSRPEVITIFLKSIKTKQIFTVGRDCWLDH